MQALVFEWGLCRENPDRLLAMPLSRINFWAEMASEWNDYKADISRRRQQRQRGR